MRVLISTGFLESVEKLLKQKKSTHSTHPYKWLRVLGNSLEKIITKKTEVIQSFLSQILFNHL